MKATIEQKIIIAIVVAVSLILGLVGTYQYVSSRSKLMAQALRGADSAAARLSTSLVSPVWDLNKRGAEEFLGAEMTARDVYAIVVHDSKGGVFAAKGRNAGDNVVDIAGVVTGKFTQKTKDIIKDNEKIGLIDVYFTNRYVNEELQSQVIAIIGQAVLIDLVTIGVLLLLIRGVVTRPLKRVMTQLKEISEGDGDLTVSLPEEGAMEISQLAQSFNIFVQKTRTVIEQVKDLNNEMVSAAEELSASTSEIAKSNDAVSDQSRALATAAEQMSATVAQVERDSGTVRDASENAQQTATNGVQVISQSIAAMEEISNVVRRAVVTVQGLGEESQKIRIVVDVIEDIADQTNLLALNAAIEAARAGEHGRGFAVVADEVRKLAEKTVKATAEVSKTIASIRLESDKAVEVMSQGQQAVGSMVTLAKQAGDSIREIDTTVSVATAQTHQIASATQELAATIRDMTQNVEHIAVAVEHNSLATVEVAKTADSVAKKADHLQSVTATFRT